MTRRGWGLLAAVALVQVLVVGWLVLLLFDSAPPVLHLDAPAEGAFVSGPQRLAVTAQDELLGVRGLTASLDGDPLPLRGGPATLLLDDGQHLLEVCAFDTLPGSAPVCLQRRFVADSTAPSLQLDASARRVAQGDAAAVLLLASELVSLEASFAGRPLPLRALDDRRHQGWLAASVTEAPEAHDLVVVATDRAGNATESRFAVQVVATEFPRGGFIKLDKKRQANMRNASLREQDNRKRLAAYAAEQPRWLVEGPMPWPADGVVSSPFGKVRTYNTGVVRHHLGTDLAAPAGTPVRAPAAGVVTLAEEQHIYGGAVIVKHAPGVSTSYNHLSRIDVAVGDEVQPGQSLGAVGSTGQSTGPHLHWGMVVQGVSVAAERWRGQDGPWRLPEPPSWTEPEAAGPPGAPMALPPADPAAPLAE